MPDSLDNFHPALIAADTANMQAGASESIIDSAVNLGGTALLSGFASVYNTGASLLGAEKFDVGNWLQENDNQMGAYYAANKDLADTAGFIATSFVPGGLALKGLQLAKAGTTLGPFGRALGYASSRQQFYLDRGLKELATEGGTVFGLINKNKLASIAWGTADQMISVAAFETAVAATMKQSPLLEKDDWTDVGKHIALTSLAFGGIGGGIEALAISSVFKKAEKTIAGAMREYDALRYVQGDLALGDKAYGIADSILGLPALGKNIEFTYKFAGKESSLELPTKEALERAIGTTERRGWDDFKLTINKMAEGDPELGNSYANFLVNKVKKLKEDGADAASINDFLQDNLLNVGKITRVSSDAAKGSDDIFYVAKSLDPAKIPTLKTFDDFMAAVVNRAPTGSDVSKHPYEMVGKTTDIKMGMVGLKNEQLPGGSHYPSINDAFAGGMDVAVLANGTIRINPKSSNFKSVIDPVTAPKSYFNVRTGAYSDVAFPTVADIASSAKPLAITGVDHLVSGGRVFKLATIDEFPIAKIDTLQTSARYVWAEQIKVVPTKVTETDLPLLDRIYQDGAAGHKEKIIKFADGTEKKVGDFPDFGAWLEQQKLNVLQGFFDKNPKGTDIVELATKMNTDVEWLQKGIASNFNAFNSLGGGFSVPLKESLKVQNLEIRWNFEKAQEVSNALAGTNKKAPQVLVQTLPAGAGNVIYGELGWAYRVKVAKDGYEAATAAVLGAEKNARLLPLDPKIASMLADQMGAGAGLLKFSNADYGDPLRLWAQNSGLQVNLWSKEAANATLTALQPYMIAIKDSPAAAGELGVLTTALRRTGDKYYIDVTNKFRLINKEAAVFDKQLGGFKLDDLASKELDKLGRKSFFEIKEEKVADFITESVYHNSQRIDKQKVLMTSRGFNYNYDAAVVYVPPVDTARYPFFAFVRKNAESLGGSSEVSMITAKTEQELSQLTAKVPDGYEVIFKQNTEKFHKAKGDYDYALTLKEPTIDTTLQRRGILGDFFPETRAENVLDDYINWHQRQEVSLVRRAVETKYSQVFEELRAIGRQFEEVGSSKFGGVLKKFRSQLENPFEDYLKTALDISKRGEYTLLHEANEFAEALGKSAYRIFGSNQEKAMAKTITWEEANKLSERYGIAGPYRDAEGYFKANAPEDRNIVREFVGKANMLLVNLTLRLDWANSLVNIISTPILLGTELASIRTAIAGDSELAGKLLELRSIAVPGGSARVPSTLPLIGTAVKNFWSAEKDQLLKRYKDIGAVKDMLSQYHEMVEWLSYKPYQKASQLVDWGNKAVEKGSKISGNGFAEEFTRFVSADVMRQLTDPIVAASRMTLAEQDAYISVFVNRVQGNYLSSQRPVAFQGVLGSAVSLFQTYQFNLLQQLFRHIENRDTRALATLGGLQAGIYGLNGIPFFEAVNTHLLGNSNLNPSHKDAYSTAPQIVGKEMGDWMMYGTASAFPLLSSKSPSLYTRGDINPRHISVIPVSPLDVPAVDGSIRFVNNLVDTGKKLVKGADISSTLLEGLEHNGLSRPLAGIAQVFQGYSTTSKGSLISAANDFSAVSTFSRLLGSKPLDESLALNSLFRLNAYQAADQERIQSLGEVVKTKLREGRIPTDQELQSFQLDYAKSGGRIENYSKTMQRWSRDANVSVINQLANSHRTSYSKRLMEIMGGDTIQDFRSAAVVRPTDETP